MQLNKSFDYALRSLVHLATLPDGATAELRSISGTRGVPASYLAKVMRSLVRGGLVTSTLGRVGGYSLRKPPGEISLLEVYEVMEGRMKLVECLDGNRGCAFFEGCTQASVWMRLTGAVEDVLRQTTVQDLLPRNTGLPRKKAHRAKEEKYARAGA